MKYLKWLPLLPVAVFPYMIWLVGRIDELLHISPVIQVVLYWLLGLAGAVIVFWQSVRGRWEGRRLALASMLVKLFQIQNYVVLFLGGAGLGLLFPAIAVVIWVIDVATIFLSGLVGLAGVIRCRVEGRLTTKAMVVNGILQFVFCADVFSAIWVYRNSKEAFLS